MPLKKITRYEIVLPDGSSTLKKFILKSSALRFKKKKKIDEGKVRKVIFRSELIKEKRRK